jgi:hypothetical protein
MKETATDFRLSRWLITDIMFLGCYTMDVGIVAIVSNVRASLTFRVKVWKVSVCVTVGYIVS